MHDAMFMELADSYNNLSDVKPDNVLGELLMLLKQTVQVTSFDVRHDKV